MYRAEVIGSMLRPSYLKAARADLQQGSLSAAEFKRLEDRAVAHRRRRAEHQGPRARNVPARMRIRAAHVADDEIVGAQLALEPVDVDHCRQVRHGRGTLAG